MIDPTVLEKLEAEHGELVVFDDDGVVLRPLTAAEFDRHFDERQTQPGTCDWNVTLRQLVAPTVAELVEKRAANASLPRALARGLQEFAGSPETTDPRIDPLSATTPPGILEAAGLSADAARELLERSGGAKLALIAHESAAVVVRQPKPDEYSLLQSAIASGKNVAAALRRAALDHVVWSSMPIAELFKMLPGFPVAIVAVEVLRLGGAGTEARFRPRARTPRGAA